MNSLFLLVVAQGLTVQAPTIPVSRRDPPRKEISAARIANRAAPRVDGRLDDAAWSAATFRSDFIAKQPVEGAPPSVSTAIGFLYDDDALYIGARLASRGEGDVQPIMTRRDDWGNSEVLVILLDTYLDRRTAYGFAITPAGVRIDFFTPTDDENTRDFGWNPVWEAETTLEPAGWTAELRIPFSQLRFNNADAQTWGLNVNRWLPSRNEDIFWIMVPRAETGWSSRFGNLVGLRGIHASRGIELLPYAATSSRVTGNRNPADPFDDGRNLQGRVGADLKLGIGHNLTLDATVNPDFGQVEADPAEVNLSAFETTFSERRPFFTEGGDLLRGGGKDYFYSRRIGGPPHGGVSGSFVDRPANSTILGAAKLTGQLPSGLSVGALAAITDRERATTFDSVTRSFGNVRVEPVTAYGLVRLRQQFGQNQSTAGIMLTGVRRDLGSADPLGAVLNHDAWAAATDWNVRFQGGRYLLSAYAGATLIQGTPAAITRAQRSSARYFQRPDVSHIHLDTTRTSLPGFVYGARFQKAGGRHWLWSVYGEVETPGHERNDLGRIQTSDNFESNASLRYRESRPGRVFYSYDAQVTVNGLWNLGWSRQGSGFAVSWNGTFRNYWSTHFDFDYDAAGQNDRLTRGGPSMATPAGWSIEASVSSNSRLATSVDLDLSWGRDAGGGRRRSASLDLAARLSDRFLVSAQPGYSYSVDARQYVDQVAGGPAATYGRRYIFATIERSTLSAEIRASFSATPDLTLELYAEPFVTSGRYYGLGELTAARVRDLRLYGTAGTTLTLNPDLSRTVTDGAQSFTLDNPDFQVRSFRSNLVLRWEWRPGSTLFLVWQQDRGSSEPFGTLVRPRGLWDALTSGGDHFFAVKLTYWLPV